MSPDAFRLIADRLIEPVLMLAPDGRVLAYNAAAQRALGNDLQGTVLATRCTDPAALRRYLTLASRTATPLPGAARFTGENTSWRCDASAAMLADGPVVILHLRPHTDSTRRFLALNEQIARLRAEIKRREALERERRLLLERERQARSAAEEAGRLKDDLLASVSHELRTPLHAISGWLALIRDNLDDRDMLLRGIEVIERNVDIETQLADDLVDLALTITGRMRLDVQPVDLERIVRQAVDSARPAAEAKQQRIEVVADVSCVVTGDPNRLLQVVWNLMSNATRHTPKGGKIQVVLRRVNSHAEIVVSDTGEGIAPDVLPYVFDRFRRGEGGTTRRKGGLGLGLAIVRHLVELHGGVVMAHSDGDGAGSTFTVNLPLPVFRPSSAAAPARAARTGEERELLAGIRVLLVEDHADSRELLTEILCARGAAVTDVDSSAAGLATASDRPDIIISDIEMPDEDGFTFMRKWRDLEHDAHVEPVPAIAVSAHSIGDARLHALRAGYQTFVPKPVKPAELVAMVASMCQRRRHSGTQVDDAE